MQKPINFQDSFLSAARRERAQVTLFLMNGFQLKGVVRGFDNFAVLVDSEGRQQMIYKHAISTISPMKNLKLDEGGE